MIALKEYRLKKGFTQKQIAEALGVVPSCVTQWENGVRNPDVFMLKKLAELLDCTTDELLESVSESIFIEKSDYENKYKRYGGTKDGSLIGISSKTMSINEFFDLMFTTYGSNIVGVIHEKDTEAVYTYPLESLEDHYGSKNFRIVESVLREYLSEKLATKIIGEIAKKASISMKGR